MVVLSAAVCTKAGKALLARQFVAMPKMRIEGLLAAFPKLLEGDSQHTFIETDDVRYVYQPLEGLYVLLITNKFSNIIEDLETLRLLVKLVPEYCHGHTEEAVSKHAFDLVFAIDEVITVGYKDTVTLQQIKTFTEMDSHEEKLQKIIMDSKINEAREAARKKAATIEQQKADMRKMIGGQQSGGYQGMGNNSSMSSDSYNRSNSPSSPVAPQRTAPTPAPQAASKKESAKPVKGMQLAKGNKSNDFMNAFSKEEKMPSGASPMAAAAQHVVEAHVQHRTVTISVDEKLHLELERSGGVQKMEVKGDVKLCVFDPDQSKVLVKTSGAVKGIQYSLHPKMDRTLWESEGVLSLKDRSKGFPIGSDNAPLVLRYRWSTKEECEIPFSVNVWPSTVDGRSVVNVEIQLVKSGFSWRDIIVSIPCATQEPPEVGQIDGDFSYDRKCLSWRIPHLSDDKNTATAEFSVPEIDGDSFFPVNINCTSNELYSGLQIHDIVLIDGDKTIDFAASSSLTTDKFVVA